ncbi:MAG: response regulator transcription factor [Oscillospiraceae bacterium]|jgi:DNA-binding NarL/FixJ family response regulator|nr:response regulator transcription factor [Oscillospiraceae bacterium]
MSTKKIYFINSETLLLESLDVFFSSQSDFAVVGKSGKASVAVKEVESLSPDVVLVDLKAAEEDGSGLLAELRRVCPSARLLVLTTGGEISAVIDAIGAGADGYMLKSAGRDAIINAARVIAAGQAVLDRGILAKLHERVKDSAADSGLSGPDEQEYRRMLELLKDHERAICVLVGKGKSNKEISETLHLTEGTVKNYLSRIYNKMGLRDRTSLAVIMARYS